MNELKLAACGILQIGNRFVAIKRKDKESYGLIGGKAEKGETLPETIIRETLEETGFDVEIDYSQGIFSKIDNSSNYLTVTFILKLKNNHQQIPEDEVPILYLLDKEQLINMSEYADYNKAVFEHFKL